MTKNNPAGLRISPEKYHMADIIMAVVFVLITILALYYALVDGVRDFWLLVVVGIVGAILMVRRVLPKPAEK